MEWLGNIGSIVAASGIGGILVALGVKALVGIYRKRLPRAKVVHWSFKKWLWLKNKALKYDIRWLDDSSEEAIEEAIVMTNYDASIGCIAAMSDFDPRKLAKLISDNKSDIRWANGIERANYIKTGK